MANFRRRAQAFKKLGVTVLLLFFFFVNENVKKTYSFTVSKYSNALLAVDKQA